MSRQYFCCSFVLTMLAMGVAPAIGQTALGTAFTYQGNVRLGSEPLNASADFQFTLWDAATLGNQVGAMAPVNNVAVEDGLFTVSIDFGATGSFNPVFNGSERWLQVAVRSPAGSGVFTTLSPRQALTATPYALFSTAPWATNGNNISNFNINSNVGIGTRTPTSQLTIAGMGNSLRLIGPGFPTGHGATLSFGLEGSAYISQTTEFDLTMSASRLINLRTGSGVVVRTFGSQWGIQLQNAFEDVYQGGMMLNSDGFLYMTNRIDGATGWARLDSAGNWSTTSDRRVKRDIAPLDGLLDKALALQPVSYYYKQQDMEQTPHRQIGFIAQDVELLFPSLVLGDEKKTLNYAGLSVVAIGAVQELKREKDAEIEALRSENNAQLAARDARIDALHAENAALAARLANLEALLTERSEK